MTELGKEFSVACNGKVPSTYRFPGADLVLFTCSHQTMLSKIRKFSSKIDSGLFTKITSSPPKYRLLQQNIEFSTKLTGSPPKYVGVSQCPESTVLRHSSRTPTLNAANSTIFIRQYVLTSIQLESNWNCSRKGHHSQTESVWGVKPLGKWCKWAGWDDWCPRIPMQQWW